MTREGFSLLKRRSAISLVVGLAVALGAVMRLDLEVLDDELDEDQLDQLTGRLSRELRDLDVDEVQRPSSGSAPAGAKGTFTEIATLLIAFSDSRALSAVVGTVRAWLGSGGAARKVRLSIGGDELEVDGLSSDEQQTLIRAWLARHGEI